ncbi:MAG: site-2 protease family protein [Geobacter sp.]|nr:site-2 protease family protein [Geobacter sp.]
MIENILFKLSIMLVPGLLAITCHEVAHGYVAWRYGDPTARMLGRLTLNPLKHIDIFGTMMLVIVGIGWAKPVPVVIENLRNPKKDMVWVSVAGPVTNILLALASAGLLRFIMMVPSGSSEANFMLQPLSYMVAFSIYINLLLAFFNMIPIPPLDGGRVLMGLLPYRQSIALGRIEPYGMILIIVLVFFTPIFSYLLLPLLMAGINLLAGPYSLLVFKVASFKVM